MSEFREEISQESLLELLNESFSSEGDVVNFTSLRVLLLALMSDTEDSEETVDMMETADMMEMETEKRRKEDVGQDVDESQPPSLSISDMSKQLEDNEEAVSKSTSLMQESGRDENQELREEKDRLKKEVERLQNQLSQELKESITGTGFPDTSREINVSSTPRDPSTNISDRALGQVSSGAEQNPESPEALMDIAQLDKMQKSLEAHVERLEGKRENMLERFSKFQVTVSQSRDSFSGLGQQHHLQTADLRIEVQKLHEELQNVKQKVLALREQKGSLEKEMQDTHQPINVQEAVLQLQAEYEKLRTTTHQLVKDKKQKESHTEELYKFMKELDEKIADKEIMKTVEDIKSEMQTLENKVLLCDKTAAKLKKKFMDLFSNFSDHKETCEKAHEKIFQELDCKVNQTEMDHLKKQLEVFRLRILKLHTLPAESDDAAVVRKQCLTKFKCLPFDGPDNMSIPEPSMLVLPKPPSSPAPKHNRRPRHRTKLDESAEGSPTEGSMEQTREGDSCGFDERVHEEKQDISSVKTEDVGLTVTPPKEGKTPFILLLILSHGLPAGLDEGEKIESARKERACQATLPPLTDLTQLDKRKRMMDEMERKEWAFREQEIEKLQETRLTLLVRFLWERESQQEKVTEQRLDEHFYKLQKEKEEQVQKICSDYERSLRKLNAKRQGLEEKLKRRDIINKPRHGVFPDQQSQSNVVKSCFPDTYQELETDLSPKVPRKDKDAIRRSRRIEMLLKTHQALKDKKDQVEEKKPLRFLHRVEKPAPRPPTPTVDVPPEMLEGLEKHQELIQELRTNHPLQREEQELQREEKQFTQALQRQREERESRLAQTQSYVDGISGEVIVDMLDFLSKELVRLQEERRIHAFVLLAERDRRLREAEESGRRQVEERRQREEDEIFRQVTKVHQSTVDLYLEDVILKSIDQTAEAQAREEIQKFADELDNLAYAMEETRTNEQTEEIVAEHVYGFLIPEVNKVTAHKRVKQSQRRHLTAPRTLIHDTDSSSTSPRPLSPASRAATSLLSEIIEQMEEASHKSDDHQENEHTD
ncbi:hypothetical protein KOW79_004839 [Hemibagrus wyckioides]|uniref:Cilia- and flagella-associated protein 91 n=1 Tax=Hemibagrus wyckioides TaxID=337641 RepID=A0A9D3P0V7_9TELE|nr:hypothetical protein KOW79_004839 [Hemibagrus wyckioides]